MRLVKEPAAISANKNLGRDRSYVAARQASHPHPLVAHVSAGSLGLEDSEHTNNPHLDRLREIHDPPLHGITTTHNPTWTKWVLHNIADDEDIPERELQLKDTLLHNIFQRIATVLQITVSK